MLSFKSVTDRTGHLFYTQGPAGHDHQHFENEEPDSTSSEEHSHSDDEKDGFKRAPRKERLRRMTKKDVRDQLLATVNMEEIKVLKWLKFKVGHPPNPGSLPDPDSERKREIGYKINACLPSDIQNGTFFDMWHKYTCPFLALAAVIVAGLPANKMGLTNSDDALTPCQRSYGFLAGIICWRTSGYFLQAIRDGAIFPHAKPGHPIPPEAHFLAGSLPSSLAPTKVLAFGGFAFGIIGMFIGIMQMSTEMSRKYYIMETMLLVLTAALGYNSSSRDQSDMRIWKWEVGSYSAGARHRHSHSARVVHAIKLMLYSNTGALRPLEFLWFVMFCLAVVPTVFSILLITSGIEGVHMFTLGPIICGGLVVIDAVINIGKIEYRRHMLQIVASVLEEKLALPHGELMMGDKSLVAAQHGGYDEMSHGGGGGYQHGQDSHGGRQGY